MQRLQELIFKEISIKAFSIFQNNIFQKVLYLKVMAKSSAVMPKLVVENKTD